MFLAKVTGSVVSTHKVASLVGHKLLTVEPLRIDPKDADSRWSASAARSSASTWSAPAKARRC